MPLCHQRLITQGIPIGVSHFLMIEIPFFHGLHSRLALDGDTDQREYGWTGQVKKGWFLMVPNDRSEISFTPIGILHTPFENPEGMPIQPSGRASAPGRAEIYPEFHSALEDLDGFSHLILIYHFHRIKSWKPRVTPFMDTVERGLFSTRAPSRPNPIGISVVHLERIESGVLYLSNMDVLDGTPLLDVKPFVPAFDQPQDPVKTGWLANTPSNVEDRQSDGRFGD
jgi:tRNA-Thr(GGU) m(6)t(6)A37 methyltransferase TsaA